MTDTHPLDEHTAALWAKLDEIRNAIREMKAHEDEIASLIRERATGYGTYSIGGEAQYQLTPNRRFSVDVALGYLPTDKLEACIKQTIDPAEVKRHLTPEQVESCMVEQGAAKVVRA